MHNTIITLLLLLSLSVNGQTNNYAIGDIVSDFTVTDIYGNSYTLYDITSQGKYVYLNFFYSSCSSCQSKISIFNEFWDKYGCGQNEIFCIAINQGVDDNATVIAFENQYGGNFDHAPAIASNGGAANVTAMFGVNIFSTFCLIAPDNKMLNNGIQPVSEVKHLENVFPSGFEPLPAPCTNSLHDETNPLILTANNNELLINFHKELPFSLFISDLSGKLLYHNHFYDNTLSIILNYKPGIYIAKLTYHNKTLIRKFIIQ